jgi:hypothetical protein
MAAAGASAPTPGRLTSPGTPRSPPGRGRRDGRPAGAMVARPAPLEYRVPGSLRAKPANRLVAYVNGRRSRLFVRGCHSVPLGVARGRFQVRSDMAIAAIGCLSTARRVPIAAAQTPIEKGRLRVRNGRYDLYVHKSVVFISIAKPADVILGASPPDIGNIGLEH